MKTIPMLLALALALTGRAAAQFTPMATAAPDSVPGGMNYQGRLEKDGFPVTGTRTMAFRLYDASSGGTALYNSGNLSVAVQQGIFAVSLDIPFGALTGTAQKYLEIEVEGIVLTPRDALRSVPYAKVAETVEGTINISTAGLTFTTNVGDSLAISSGSGRVGIGTASPLARLHVSSGTGETGVVLLVSTGASTLASVDGNGVLTANHFVGDGTNLRNVVRRSGDSMSGSLTLNGSTLTVGGSGFSVAGAEFTVGSGRTGVGTASPLAVFTVVGDSSFSQPATFLSSVTVRSGAQFGAGAKQSSFTAQGDLTLYPDASLTVGTTFFVGNARVGVGTGSPSASSRLHVVGDVLIGNPTVHDTSVNSDLLVDGNVVVDGTFIQHGAGGSVFERLSVSGGLQGNQTFAVGYTSFGVTTGGNVGINTLTPLAKLTVVGDSSFSQPATFASSATVVGGASVGGNLGLGTTAPASKLAVIGDVGVTGVSTFGSSLTVRNAAAFGTAAGTIISAAGAFTVTSGQNVTLSGGSEILGLVASPAATGAASKEYVDSQTLAGSGWTRDLPNTEVQLSNIGDEVGIGTASPLAKLSVVGDMSVSLPATFGSSITVRNAASFGTTGQSSFSNTGVLTLGTALAAGSGGTGNTNGTAAALTTNPADCGANNFATAIAANGDLTCAAITDADVPNTITINAAAALAANPVDCGANSFATTIAANGDLTCAAIADADVPNNITISLAATATALAADPADCGANTFANAIAASGALTCGAIGDADVPNTITVNANAIAAGTMATTVIAQSVGLVSANKATLMGTAAGSAGRLYYCSDCTGGVGGAGAVVVSTGTGLAGQFAISDGGPFQ